MWNFKGTVLNCTQNTSAIHWKMCSLLISWMIIWSQDQESETQFTVSIIQILWKFVLLYRSFQFWWWDQITHLHMLQQVSCHGMCRVTWSHNQFSSKSNMHFYKIDLWTHKFLWNGPKSLLPTDRKAWVIPNPILGIRSLLTVGPDDQHYFFCTGI